MVANDAIAYVALGSNLGDPRANVLWAMDSLRHVARTRVLARSSLWRSAPLDADGPDFINAVVRLQTRLDPLDLLRSLQALEQLAGRERPYPNAPRTLDLDLLMVGDLQMNTAELTLPHPRMHARAFVLLPLAEIAPDLVDARMRAAVQDQRIERID